MANISEFLIEPSVVDVNESFRIKIKVNDIYGFKGIFITEDNIRLITEDGNLIRTEWDNNE